MKHTQGRDVNWCLTALLPSNWWHQTRVIGWSAVQSKQLAGTLLNGPWKRHWGPASEIRSHSGSLVLWETGQTFNTSNQPVRLQVRGTRRQDEEKMWRWAHICCHSPSKFVHEMNKKNTFIWTFKVHECEMKKITNWSRNPKRKTHRSQRFHSGTCGFTLTSPVRNSQGKAKIKN